MREKLETLQTPAAPARRRLLGLGLAALTLPLAKRLAALTPSEPGGDPLPPDRDLAFYNTHTAESADVEYCRSGCLVPESLRKINYILRDTRTGDIKDIDVSLLDLLSRLARKLGTDEPFHVISGYRSPSTNEYLRTHGGGGVAAHSLHLVGKAIDIRVPGVKLRNLYKTAIGLRGGGVGIYPASDFVHVDVGRVRTW
jgi:uncharacterized protein YcbK (DUF882 family)